MTRTHGDLDATSAMRSVSPPGGASGVNDSFAPRDWDDSGAANGLTARADAAGFSPVRFNKGRQHSLDVDPRTKLKIINVPAERRVAFADLQDVVIHVFVDCFKITSSDQYAERVLIVTDQTLFLCGKEGAVARCVMVDAIKSLFVSHDNRALGIQIPSEYDILVKFVSSADRDRTIKVLRTVYRRLSHNRLPVETIAKGKKFDPKEFKISKPPNFRLSIIQQRTREQLREALELFEQEEEAMLEEIDMVQDEMEDRHKAKMMDMQTQLEISLQKLKDVVKEVWDNEAKLTKLRDDVSKGKKLIEQVDGVFGPDGELPVSKDAQISELELIVARLNAAVYASGSEISRKGDPDNAITFFQKDLQEQLYQPSWPGTDQVKDMSSLVKALQEKVATIEEEIRDAKRVLEEGRLTERRMQYVEERMAFLKQGQRAATFMKNAAAANPTIITAGARGGKTIDQGLGFLADLPQEITVETLTSDPRTGLHFVQVPDVMRVYFQDLTEAVLHFFAVVRKPSKTGELVKRVLLINDSSMYLCTPNGTIKRCLDIIQMNEILLDRAFGIGIRCAADYDVTFQCATGDHRQEIVDIIQRIFRYLSGGKVIAVTDIPKHQRLEGFLKLSPPPGYTMQLTQFRTRQELVDAIRQRRDIALHNTVSTKGQMAGASSGGVPADLGSLSEEEYLMLRQDVAREMDAEWRQDATLVQLRAELDQLDKLALAAADEVILLKKKIDDHRCEDGVTLSAGSFPIAPGSGIMPSSGPGTFRPAADGLFFIKVEPESINCELEVHKVTFNQSFIFTGHSNGFVNVWDLNNTAKGRPLLRSLREHTGKITGLCCTEADLLTSSSDSTLRLWDLSKGQVKYRLHGHRGAVNSVYMNANRIVSGGHDTFVHVWDKETGEQLHVYRGHKSQINGVKFDGNLLVSCEWGWALVWDMRSSKIVRTLKDDQGGISSFDFADGVLACGGCGGDLTVWDVSKSTGETISAHDDDILCVQLAGRNAITSGGDYKINMWDIAAMKSLGNFHNAHPFEPKSFKLEGKLMISGEGPCVKIWSK